MIQISPEDVITVNNSFNNADAPWINRNLLDSAFSAYSYYDSEIEQVCSIFRGLVKNHAFSDGNKRTASAILTIWLEQNGYSILPEDLCDITLDVATHNYDVSEIVQKLEPMLIHNTTNT